MADLPHISIELKQQGKLCRVDSVHQRLVCFRHLCDRPACFTRYYDAFYMSTANQQRIVYDQETHAIVLVVAGRNITSAIVTAEYTKTTD